MVKVGSCRQYATGTEGCVVAKVGARPSESRNDAEFEIVDIEDNKLPTP